MITVSLKLQSISFSVTKKCNCNFTSEWFLEHPVQMRLPLSMGRVFLFNVVERITCRRDHSSRLGGGERILLLSQKYKKANFGKMFSKQFRIDKHKSKNSPHSQILLFIIQRQFFLILVIHILTYSET